MAATLGGVLFGGRGRLFQEFNGVSDGRDRFRLVVGNFDVEFFLERHDQLNGIERVGAEIVDEIRVFDDLVGVDAQMFDDNLLNALSDIAHLHFPSCDRANGPALINS
jgi:hypothetical protein